MKLFPRSLFFLTIVCSAAFAVETPGAEPQKVVLALYGSRPDLPSNILVDDIIRSTLERQLGSHLDFYAEFLDATRWPEEEARSAFHDLLRRKYSQKKPNVVLAIARPAINFMRLYGNEIFPGVPIVAYGDLDALQDWDPARPIMGALGRVDVKGTVELALRLQPRTHEIIAISGVSPSDQWLQSSARKQLAELENRVKITYIGGTTVENLETTLAAVPDGTAILFLSMYEDSEGNKLLSTEVLSRIARRARVPVYSFVVTYIGLGIVGGVGFDPESLGRETAQLTLRVLNGERIQGVSIQEGKSAVPVVDWRQLRRWHLPLDRLPPGTILENEEPGLWRRYRLYVLGALAVFALELTLILMLLYQVKKRRASEAALIQLSGRLIQTEEDERRRIGRELHDDVNQRLALLAVDLQMLSDDPIQPEISLPVELRRMHQDVRGISKDLTDLSHHLHSSALEVLGIVTSLRKLCKELSDHHHRTIEFASDDNTAEPSTDIALCLFRITQESLSNVIKHSGASKASVELRMPNANLIHLVIVDNGKGFGADKQQLKDGLGLLSMRERLRLVRGVLSFSSAPMQGTRVEVQIPFRSAIKPISQASAEQTSELANDSSAAVAFNTRRRA